MQTNNADSQSQSIHKHIVVIEDDPTMRDLLNDFLGDEKFDFATFESVTEFNQSKIKSIDIIISDIMLQKDRSAGAKFVLEYIKNKIQAKHPRIIFISNFGKDSIRYELKELEKNECSISWIPKPFSMLDLNEKILSEETNGK